MPRPSGPLVMTIKLKINKDLCMAAMLSLHFLTKKKNYLNCVAPNSTGAALQGGGF